MNHRVVGLLSFVSSPKTYMYIQEWPYSRTFFCFAGCKKDIVFLLDSSTSVGINAFDEMLKFCKTLLNTTNIDSGDVRVGVATYNTNVMFGFQMLNEYKTKGEVFNAIDNIPRRHGSTNTADALQKMHSVMFTTNNGDRPDVDNAAVLITDGVSNINSRRTIPEAEYAHEQGILVIAIGIGLTDTMELNSIASSPASEYAFAIQTFANLADIVEEVFNEIFGPLCWHFCT